jgi:predicted DNA-binding transcriptional regulator AlpA
MDRHFPTSGGAKVFVPVAPTTASAANNRAGRRARQSCERRRAIYVPDDPLLTAAEAAEERRQALSTFWRDVKRGLVPPAIYVSPRCPRWRRSEIRAALEAKRAPRREPG